MAPNRIIFQQLAVTAPTTPAGPARHTTLLRSLLSLLLVCLAVLSLLGSLDQQGEQYTQQGFTRALITFGIAKALNGVISVAQGTEVAVQPAGVGVNFTPGEILDPVNDLVEQFSWIMLASTVSLGVQKTLISMGQWQTLNIILSVITFIALLLLWYGNKIPIWIKHNLFRFTLVVLLLRFAVPVFAIANEWVYQQFLNEEYSQASQQLQDSTSMITSLNEGQSKDLPNVGEKSIWDTAKELYRSTASMLDIEKRIEKYRDAAATTTENAIRITVVFIIQIVVLPLLFLALVYYLVKWLMRNGEKLFV